MVTTNEDIQIYGKLVNVSTEGVVADASQIWSERNSMSIEDAVKTIDNKVEDFKSNPEFDKATFHGDVLFEGNTTVDGSQTVRGNQTVNGNQEVRGTLDVYDKISAHGNPTGIEVDHKLVCNDLEVMGVFKALQLDCNTLTVHKTIKSEGDLRVDGETTVNNITINGKIQGAGAEDLLPNGKEGDILVYQNGKWTAGDLSTLVKQNQDVNNYIDNRINQLIQQAIGGDDIDNKIEQVVNRYWVKNGSTLTPATGISNVNAYHFFKITAE